MVAIQVSGCDIRDAVTATARLVGAEVIKGLSERARARNADRHHVDACVARRAADTVSKYDAPLAIVKAADLRCTKGIAKISGARWNAGHRGGIPLTHDQARRVSLAEIAGIRDVERVDCTATGA